MRVRTDKLFLMVNPLGSEALGIDVLPFSKLTDYQLMIECESNKKYCIDKLENSGFLDYFHSDNMNNASGLDMKNKKQYFDIDELNNISNSTSTELSLFHINIRRFSKNKGKLYALLMSLEEKFDIIVLTEIGDNAAHFLNDR